VNEIEGAELSDEVRTRVAVGVEILRIERIAGAVEIPDVAATLLLVIEGGIRTTDSRVTVGELQGEWVGVGVGEIVVGGDSGGLRLREDKRGRETRGGENEPREEAEEWHRAPGRAEVSSRGASVSALQRSGQWSIPTMTHRCIAEGRLTAQQTSKTESITRPDEAADDECRFIGARAQRDALSGW
jgi:hypothetical protein